MMQVSAQSYSSVAEMSKSYADRHRRMMEGAPRKPAKVVVAPTPAPLCTDQVWRTGLSLFDAHKRDYEAAVYKSSTSFLRHACRAAGFSLAYLKSGSRNHLIVSLRAYIVVVLRDRFGLSLLQIARVMNRDHTSVLNLIRKYADDIDTMRTIAIEGARAFDRSVAEGHFLEVLTRTHKLSHSAVLELIRERGLVYRRRPWI